jgi:hypothetical protein
LGKSCRTGRVQIGDGLSGCCLQVRDRTLNRRRRAGQYLGDGRIADGALQEVNRLRS